MTAIKKQYPAQASEESRVKQLYCVWSNSDEESARLGRGIENEQAHDRLTDIQLRAVEEMADEQAGSLDDVMLKLAIWAKANLPEHDPDNPYNSIVVSALADLQSYCAKRVEDLN